MSFSCPPSELQLYVLETLSFSGNNGLTLAEMWVKVSNKVNQALNLCSLDDFQKQIIWQWIFFHNDSNEESLQLYVLKDSKPVAIQPNYAEFTRESDAENTFRIKPTDDTQFKYLTNSEGSKKMRLQLGEKSFELLVEIARHGPSGVISSELCKNTGQDPRSLPMRFKKLEEFGFIKKTPYFDQAARLHTNLCVHYKFAKVTPKFEDNSVLRNANRFKQLIVQAVKQAPTNLRIFKDLKSQLKLDDCKSAHKFFDAMVESLHKNGYVEKVMVKDSEIDRLIYCVKYVKDLPRVLYDVYDYIEDPSNISLQIEEDMKSSPIQLPPTINHFFPLAHQLYQQIVDVGSSGATVKAIVRNVSGDATYRPLVRLLDNISSYVLDDSRNLIPIKNYPDFYDSESVVRTYDFLGKFRFYRYYTKSTIAHESVKNHKAKAPKSSPVDSKMSALTKKFFVPLGKTPKGSFIQVNKRPSSSKTSNSTKRPKKLSPIENKENTTVVDFQNVLNLADHVQFSNDPENYDTALDESGRTPEVVTKTPEVVSIKNVGSIVPEISLPEQRKRKSEKSTTNQLTVSLKGKRRRTELLAMIKELGGVTYTTANLRRALDERLGVATMTDIKTLARDISNLIAAGDIRTEDVEFEREKQSFRRRLLILTDENFKPTKEAIDQARENCRLDVGARPKLSDKRVVAAEVKLFETGDYSQRLRRLESLEKEVKLTRRRPVLATTTSSTIPPSSKPPSSRRQTKTARPSSIETKTQTKEEPVNEDIAIMGMKNTKRKKKLSKTTETKLGKRFRQIITFELTDAITLLRAVVISKTFKRGGIDFAQIASLFYYTDELAIKQKWRIVRKKIGGAKAISNAKQSFENIVLKGIEDSSVSVDALENIRFSFFLQLWKDADKAGLESFDKNPLLGTVEENITNYDVKEVPKVFADVFDLLEDNSMRQKESILANNTFFNITHVAPPVKRHNVLRTVLKAIVFTPEEQFTGLQVKQVLSEYSEEDTTEAAQDLMKDREMLYFGATDVPTKFVLTEKVYASINVKLKSKFYHQATKFYEDFVALSQSKKGLIVSQAIDNGQMAALLHLVSTEQAGLCHIDRAQLPVGYESRLVDKEKLACDIVAFANGELTLQRLPKVPIPIGRPCGHVWLDLNGNIHESLWTKIITSVLYYIVFRPGVSAALVHTKLHTVLESNDFDAVIGWLEESKCIYKGKYDGYIVSKNAFSILGF